MLRVIELACFTTSCSTQWNPTPQYLSMNEYGPLTHFNAQPTRVRILFQTYSPCGLYVKRSSIYQGWRKIGTIRRRRLRCYSPLRSQVLDLGMVEYIYVMLRAIRYGIGMCPNLPRHLYFSYHAPPPQISGYNKSGPKWYHPGYDPQKPIIPHGIRFVVPVLSHKPPLTFHPEK